MWDSLKNAKNRDLKKESHTKPFTTVTKEVRSCHRFILFSFTNGNFPRIEDNKQLD